MATNKSIDGLAPRRRKKTTSSVNADGFSPLTQPRKTSRGSSSTASHSRSSSASHSSKSARPRSATSSSRSVSSELSPELLAAYEEEFTPPRKTRSRSSSSRPASSDLLHPEDFIPPRKTSRGAKAANLDLPEITEPKKAEPSPRSTKEINDDFLEPLKTFDFDEETGELVSVKDLKDEPEDKESKKSQKAEKDQKSSRKHKKWSKKRKIWTWIGAIFALLLVGGIIWFILWGNDILAKLTGGRGNLMDLFSENYEPLKEDANGRTNVLLFGTSGFDMSGTEYGGGVHDGAELTDSIMVVSFDQDTGDAVLISLPRDLYVDADCNYTGKVNEIYYCNNLNGDDEEGGAQALQTAVGDILGLDLPYFAHLNWGSLQKIVDSIGGITVTLDEPIEDIYYTGAVYDAGVPYHLSGQDAIALSRARHGTEHGDFSRGASQQKILLGIKDKVLSDGLSVSSLMSIANTLGDNLRTNFSVGEMKTLAHLATSIDWEHIVEASFLSPKPLLTDGMIDGISYVYPTAGIEVYTEIRAYVKSLFSNENSVAEENATILILNSTGTPGLAGTEQAKLEADGFSNITVDNAAAPSSAPYTLYAFTAEKPTTKSALEQTYGITSIDSTTTPPSDIPLGYDFVLILGQ